VGVGRVFAAVKELKNETIVKKKTPTTRQSRHLCVCVSVNVHVSVFVPADVRERDRL